MTLFHSLGIHDPERSAEPNSKDAWFLLLVNIFVRLHNMSFLFLDPRFLFLTGFQLIGQKSILAPPTAFKFKQ